MWRPFLLFAWPVVGRHSFIAVRRAESEVLAVLDDGEAAQLKALLSEASWD